jgi:dihydroorotate dehydrogenase electron transfer subunit
VKQLSCAVVSNQEIAAGIFLMWLKSPEIAAHSRPGQFVMVACGEGTTLRRPISIHNVNVIEGQFALLYMTVGKGTEALARLKTGNTVDILGPMGNGFRTVNAPAATLSYLLVAGGIGIAPMLYLINKIKPSCRQIIVLQGATTAAKLYPKELFPPEVSLTVATDDGTAGHKGFITDLIPTFATTADEVVVCGPMPMLKNIANNQERLKLADKPVSVSMEMRMACGLGICYGCTIRTTYGLKEVCKDGPVFDLKDIIWDDMTRV